MEFDFSKNPGRYLKKTPINAIIEPLVSIVTPYYNAGKYFEETFNSVINQGFERFEWIIVNDGSTNQEDIDILIKFSRMDSRIRVINQQNGGLACARNTGFKNSKTELIVPLDADDLIADTCLEYLYWALYYNQDAAWAYSDVVGFQGQEYLWRKIFNSNQMKKSNLLVATAMIRKKDYEEVGGYKVEGFSYNEDWRFWLEMLAVGKKPVHVKGFLFWYRRSDSMLAGIKANKEITAKNKKIIASARKGVKKKITPIEYPKNGKWGEYYRTQYVEYSNYHIDDNCIHKVLWLIPQMVVGGADKFNLDAITGLQKKHYKNYIVTTMNASHVWQQRFEEVSEEIYNLREFLDMKYDMEFVTYLIQTRSIDVLMVTNSYEGYYMLPWLRMRFPELTIIDYVHLEEWHWRAGGYARVSASVRGISEKTYVCNSSTRNVLINHFGCKEEKVDCMYIGVDEDWFNPEVVEKNYLHEMLNLDSTTKIVLFPCRISQQKRPFMLLEIADKVCRQLEKVVFVVVGDGPQFKELQGKIKLRGLNRKIICIGSSSNMRACYNDADVVVICSNNEGLSLTAYEACSMGIPVVSSDVGGQRDLINEEVGAILPMLQPKGVEDDRKFIEEEIDSFVESLKLMLLNDELRIQKGINARKKIIEGFSIKKMVENLDEEINRVSSNFDNIEYRKKQSEALKQIPGITAEYFTLYEEWETTCRTWFYSEKLQGVKRYLENHKNTIFVKKMYNLLK